ncbi:hypothetical protein GCM10009676_24150 [Prauserella halophila]|uniref:Uncharacterized protein n=1 Tax=Prauserella halophila TaxID=185641 RepID=A0ABN1WA34_9PSEU|nr:hypothetical protein [Prauserella halophila]MCP2234802.1 hypothetical protein [Prauserella halophila]
MEHDATAAEAEFVARLGELRVDLGGTARIDVSDIPRSSWRRCRELAEAHGWEFKAVAPERGVHHWVLARPGTASVDRRDALFITGPSQAELREYPRAREVAEQVWRELGVDPLSQAALNETRAAHNAYRKTTNRFVALAVCSGLALLVVLVTAGRLFGDGGTTALVLGVVCAALLVSTVSGTVGIVRRERARRAAIRPFTHGYERVVAAVLQRGE